MKYRSNVPKYAEFVFEIVDDTFHKRAIENKEKGKHNIIIGGLSYGQGSSREHAALCPMFLGVKAVIAKSFERIHSANLINFGILPLTFKSDSDYESIDESDELEIPNVREILLKNEPLVVKNKTKGTEHEVTYTLSQRQRDIVLAGGMLPYTTKT